MCGIFCLVCKCSSVEHSRYNVHSGEKNGLLERLQRRGPDSQNAFRRKVNDGWEIEFLATVLYLRGPEIISQPVEDKEGNILLWNGEIFNGLEVTSEVNDTLLVSAALAEALSQEELLRVMQTIQGPWAIIYWQHCTQKLWFGRDVLGRRSLLWNRSAQSDQLMISSVLPKEHQIEMWDEVPAIGLFSLDLKTTASNANFSLTLYPWLQQVSCESFKAFDFQALTRLLPSQWQDLTVTEEDKLKPPFTTHLNKNVPDDETLAIVPTTVDPTKMSQEYSVIVQQFLDALAESVRLRVQAQPKLCQNCLQKWKSSNTIRHADFQRGNSSDVTNSVEEPISDHSKESLRHHRPCKHSKVGVLFSGGLDSCVLAALADRFVPLDEPIDLLNVAFQQKLSPSKRQRKRTDHQTSSPNDSSAQREQQTSADLYRVPDRISGLQGCEELRHISPSRKWNFVHINVTPEELKKERDAHVANVISPSSTVLDDSIGCAVWFAARGCGFVTENEEEKLYTTPARVLLVGMGADEQLCGYSRHRVKFNTFGWKGLIEEIDIEINRISSRNLGRDDRVISDHGRESRLPFLDENVVSFINSLPICYKANLTLPRGTGEKILLRLAAAVLGLEKTATLAKRAIQFGSRIAKAEDKCEKGSDVCARLKL